MSEAVNAEGEAPKTPMTEEERIELAAKLDRELDEFIDGLERKRYTEGWPEDRWEEEMEKHPFFMKKLPEPGDELHPMYEGLQKLKYDPEENTVDELAVSYKEDGNWYMKHKKFRACILAYTEGLHIKCENDEVNSQLYNNRSAAHFFLSNYRSSYDDAMQALKLKPDYSKAKWRAAQCSDKLDRFEQCIDLCDQILLDDPKRQDALRLRKSCNDRCQKKLRDDRKLSGAERKKRDEWDTVIEIIKMRKLKFEDVDTSEEITKKLLTPTYAPLEDHPVHRDASGNLEWPLTFCYPEFMFSDYQQEVCEIFPMSDIVHDLLMDPLECDRQGVYVPDNLNVYFVNKAIRKAFKVDQKKPLKEIIEEKGWVGIGKMVNYVLTNNILLPGSPSQMVA